MLRTDYIVLFHRNVLALVVGIVLLFYKIKQK